MSEYPEHQESRAGVDAERAEIEALAEEVAMTGVEVRSLVARLMRRDAVNGYADTLRRLLEGRS